MRLDEIGLRRSKRLKDQKPKNDFLQYLGFVIVSNSDETFIDLLALNAAASMSDILNLREVMNHLDKDFFIK